MGKGFGVINDLDHAPGEAAGAAHILVRVDVDAFGGECVGVQCAPVVGDEHLQVSPQIACGVLEDVPAQHGQVRGDVLFALERADVQRDIYVVQGAFVDVGGVAPAKKGTALAHRIE